jgi:hypothetical protein
VCPAKKRQRVNRDMHAFEVVTKYCFVRVCHMS